MADASFETGMGFYGSRGVISPAGMPVLMLPIPMARYAVFIFSIGLLRKSRQLFTVDAVVAVLATPSAFPA